MLPLHNPSKASASSNTNTQGADTHMNAAVDAPSSDADMTSSVDTAGGSSSISKTGTALYDFTAENDAELSLKVLLHILCVSPVDERKIKICFCSAVGWIECITLLNYLGIRMRSEEHTSELQSPVPISYAVFCLKKKKKDKKKVWKCMKQNDAKQVDEQTHGYKCARSHDTA